MFDIGFLELLVVAMIGLLVLGPERLPQVIKKVASFTARSRHFANHLKEEFEREANLSEMRETLTKEKAEFRQHLKQFGDLSESSSVASNISESNTIETPENKMDKLKSIASGKSE